MGIILSNYLTRYYTNGEDPFTSLNDLPLEQANELKRKHCLRNNIGGYYAQDEYLVHRLEIEKWIYGQLLLKGGNPKNNVPIYMCLGESPINSEFDIRHDIQKDAMEIKIPIEYLGLTAITFTYPDSMAKFTVDENGKLVKAELTRTPEVFLYNELENGLKKYKENGLIKMEEHYIEAQIWNREILYEYMNKYTK
jgi:hypothetical protein